MHGLGHDNAICSPRQSFGIVRSVFQALYNWALSTDRSCSESRRLAAGATNVSHVSDQGAEHVATSPSTSYNYRTTSQDPRTSLPAVLRQATSLSLINNPQVLESRVPRMVMGATQPCRDVIASHT